MEVIAIAPTINRWSNEVAEQRLIYKIVCAHETHLLDDLDPEDFYHPINQTIIAACKAIVRKGRTPDLVTLAEELSVNEVRTVNSYRHAEMGEEFGYSADGYVEILHELRERRSAMETFHNAMKALSDVSSEASVRDVTASVVSTLTQESRRDNLPHDLGSVLSRTYDVITQRARGEISPVAIGIPEMDALTGGLYPGEMTVIGARPGTGKTALALQVAVNAAESGKRVVFISREMSDVQIGERILARYGVELWKSRTGKLAAEDWDTVQTARANSTLRNILVDNRAATVDRIRDTCRRWKAGGGLDLVCIDYLQLVHSDSNGTRNDQVAEISWGCKELAIEFDIPVIVLSQLNRELRSRQNSKPLLTDLRDSGAVEQDADNVWLLWCPTESDDPDIQALIEMNRNTNHAVVSIEIAKARQSMPGTVFTQFIKNQMRFISTRPEPYLEQLTIGGI